MVKKWSPFSKNKTVKSFEEHRHFARPLKLQNEEEWKEYYDNHKIPDGILKHVRTFFTKQNEWTDWDDFLGREKYTFEDHQKVAIESGIKTSKEWKEIMKLGCFPPEFVKNPQTYSKFKGKFTTWSDFLEQKYASYIEAKQFLKKYNFKSVRDYRRLRKKEKILKVNERLIPVNAKQRYEKTGEWIDWYDFLSIAIDISSKRQIRSHRVIATYNECRNYAKKNKIRRRGIWEELYDNGKLPIGFPKNPRQQFLEKGWIDDSHFYGQDNSTTKTWLAFEEVRKFARSLNLSSKKKWNDYCDKNNLPEGIHKSVEEHFRTEGTWTNWGDFLGHQEPANFKRELFEFFEAKKQYQIIAKKSGMDKSNTPYSFWQDYLKKNKIHKKLPHNPSASYDLARVKKRLKGIKPLKDLQPGIDYYYDFYDTFGIEDSTWRTKRILELLEDWLKDDFLLKADPIIINSLYQIRQLGKIEGKLSKIIKLIPTHHKDERFNEFLKTVVKSKGGTADKVNEFELNIDHTVNNQKDYVDIQKNSEYQTVQSKDVLSQPNLENISEILSRGQKTLQTISNKKFNPKHQKNDFVDKEAIQFYLRHYVQKIWTQAFLNETKTIKKIKSEKYSGRWSSEIKNIFLKEYYDAKKLKIPNDFVIREINPKKSEITDQPFIYHQPTLMQRFFASKVVKSKYFANFSGTGAGKTISALLAGTILKSKMTVIVCPNSVVTQWRDVIKSILPQITDKQIHFKRKAFTVKREQKHSQYLIINYDQYNQEWSNENLQELSSEKIDYVILDEIHYSKTSEKEHQSKRRMYLDKFLVLLNEKNRKMKTVGLSATPIVNNLIEGRSILELLSGKDWIDLKVELTTQNAMKLHEKFTLMSIREEPKFTPPITIEKSVIATIPEEFEIKNLNQDRLAIEQYCTKARLPEIIKSIKSTEGKTIVYTEFVKGNAPNMPYILDMLKKSVKNAGFKYATYTGEEHHGKKQFIEDDKTKVLIASEPIGTGVDGLQEVCHNIVFNNLPWTHAQYAQVVGRLVRKKQKSKVTVHHILSKVRYDGVVYEYDIARINAIKEKKTTLDCAVSGIIPNKDKIRKNTIIKSLRAWIQRLQKMRSQDIRRPYRIYDLTPQEIKSRRRKFGDFEKINKKLISSTSENNFKLISDNSKLWYSYHGELNQIKKKWGFDPNDIWIEQIRKMNKNLIIGDFGCGEAVIGNEFGKKRVHSFDLHAVSNMVTACNMKKVPLKDNAIDIAVYNLSLTCTDWKDLILEGTRVLRANGYLFLADTVKHFEGYLKELPLFLEKQDLKIISNESQGQFTIIKAIKL